MKLSQCSPPASGPTARLKVLRYVERRGGTDTGIRYRLAGLGSVIQVR